MFILIVSSPAPCFLLLLTMRHGGLWATSTGHSSGNWSYISSSELVSPWVRENICQVPGYSPVLLSSIVGPQLKCDGNSWANDRKLQPLFAGQRESQSQPLTSLGRLAFSLPCVKIDAQFPFFCREWSSPSSLHESSSSAGETAASASTQDCGISLHS